MVEEDEAVIFLRQNTHLFSFQCYLLVCTVCFPMLREEFPVRTATLNLNDTGHCKLSLHFEDTCMLMQSFGSEIVACGTTNT